MIRLRVQHVSKTHRRTTPAAVEDASFELEDGQLLALVGESGSGKSTLLRLIAGLEEPDTGTITLDGRILSSPGCVVPPEQRGIGLVFQSHALFPTSPSRRTSNLVCAIFRVRNVDASSLRCWNW
jgi:iron(III) transport system ATP-binding protein